MFNALFFEPSKRLQIRGVIRELFYRTKPYDVSDQGYDGVD